MRPTQGFQSYIQSQSQSQSFSLQSQSQSFYLKIQYQSQSQFLRHQSFNIFRVILTKCQKTIFLFENCNSESVLDFYDYYKMKTKPGESC